MREEDILRYSSHEFFALITGRYLRESPITAVTLEKRILGNWRT